MALPYVTTYLVARPDEAFPLEHPYVADFYTPLLGPTSVAFLRWVGQHLTLDQPTEVDLTELAARLGLQRSLSRHAPLMRMISRLCVFNLTAWNPEPNLDTDGRLLIVDHLPPISNRQVARWPKALAAEHHEALNRYRRLGRSA